MGLLVKVILVIYFGKSGVKEYQNLVKMMFFVFCFFYSADLKK